MRRGLLLIAKVIQNLANNVLFGAKEPYMFPLNDFLTQNIYHVTTFLREISVSVQPPPSLLLVLTIVRLPLINWIFRKLRNRSTLARAWPSIASSTTTGTTSGKLWSRGNDGST